MLLECVSPRIASVARIGGNADWGHVQIVGAAEHGRNLVEHG